MRVLLISANTESINMPALPLGLACVAAATRRAGHQVTLLNLMFEEDAGSAIARAIQEVRPDVIGVSVRSIDDQNMQEPKFLLDPVRQVVADCRRLCSAPIVLGGAGYSIFPESALRFLGADMGIQGAGETVFPEVVNRIGAGRAFAELPSVYLPGHPSSIGNYSEILDELPLPEPALWIPAKAHKNGFWVPVQSRRGCPMDCSFCSTSAIEGRPIRRRSPERLVHWLVDLRKAGHRHFCFVDNTFNLPPSYAKELCRRIIHAGIDCEIWCMVYPKWIDSELVTLMKLAGCSLVSLGFESGSDRILRRLHKRFLKEEVAAAAKLFEDAGIARHGFLLLGGPGETRETVEESLEFADSLHLDGLKITAGLRIYPQTPLARTAVAQGVLGPDEDLLWPRFYVEPELRDWLPHRAAAYETSHPQYALP